MAAKKKPTARKTTTKRKPRSKTGSPRPSAPKIRIANLREGNSASPLLTKFCASMVMPYRIQSDLRGSWQGPLIEKQRAIIICDGLVRRILPIALNSEQHMAAAMALQSLPDLTAENIGIVGSVVANVFANLENYNGPDTPGVSSVWLTYEALASTAEMSWVSASLSEYERVGYDAAMAILKTTETKASKVDISNAISAIIDALVDAKVPDDLKNNPYDARRRPGSRGTSSARGSLAARAASRAGAGSSGPAAGAGSSGPIADPNAVAQGTAAGGDPNAVNLAEAVLANQEAKTQADEATGQYGQQYSDIMGRYAEGLEQQVLDEDADDNQFGGMKLGGFGRSNNPRHSRMHNPRGGSFGPPTRDSYRRGR